MKNIKSYNQVILVQGTNLWDFNFFFLVWLKQPSTLGCFLSSSKDL